MSKIEPIIIVDVRESFKVKKVLSELGCKLIEELITPADYVLSEDFAIERKRVYDFLKSIYDGRLFEQAERMAQAYEKPILIVEGELYKIDEVYNEKIFWGALAKVMAEYYISVIFTSNFNHTAIFLYSLAKKIQEKKQKRIVAKHKPRIYTLSHRQLIIVQSLPNIGPKRAESLLKKFGSVRKLLLASDKELLSIEGLGKKTVQEIRKLLDTKYPGLENFSL